MKRIVLTAAIGCLLLSGTTGCIGGFAVTERVRKFNLEATQNRWAREGVFLLLYFVPVYPFAHMADLFFVNALEFHTGTNPVSGKARIARVGETRIERAPDGKVAISALREDGSVDVLVTAPDGRTAFLNLQDRGETLVARDAQGRALAELGRDGVARSLVGPDAPAAP